jgi:aryl-alcohol dehydrogenase-like predicted oxidoreductase
VPYGPLGTGFLAGSVNIGEQDVRRHMPRFQGEALEKNRSHVAALAAIAEQSGRTSAQLALAWILHQGDGIVPIPGTTKVHRLEENLGAADIALSPEELRQIELAVPPAAGERFDEDGKAKADA